MEEVAEPFLVRLGLLARHNIGAVVVSESGTDVTGIVSERDVVRHLHHDGTVVNNTVRAIMTREVEVCRPDASLDDVMETMTRRRFRHLPVVGEAGLEGVVSIGDVVKARIDELAGEARELVGYIQHGR